MSDYSTNDDLDVVWARIIATCNKEAGWDLDSRKAPSANDILASIKQPKHDKSGIQDKATKVFKKTPVVIQKFDSMVAQATGQCFNAISFVIGAVQRYDEVFANVATLMERVSAFLENLEVYLQQKLRESQTMSEKGLRTSVYRVLEHFLTILGIWHKLTTRKSAKLSLAVKVVVFGEDGGVKGAMVQLETLVTQVTRAQVTKITVGLSAAAQSLQVMEETLDRLGDAVERIEEGTNEAVANSKTIIASLGRHEKQDEDNKLLKDIRVNLNVDETKHPWEDRQEELCGMHVDGTGNWLIDYSPFSRWAEFMDSSHSAVLSIKAPEGFGKSFLCSVVIKHLQDLHRGQNRASVAYYYFQKDDFASGKLNVNIALKSILFQLAEATTTLGREFAKLVQKAFVLKPELGRTGELWNQLMTDAASLD